MSIGDGVRQLVRRLLPEEAPLPATPVDAVTPEQALKDDIYRVTPPLDRDLAGVWRAVSFSIGLLGLTACRQAVEDRDLDRVQRTVSVAVAGTYGTLAAFSFARRGWLAEKVRRHPRKAIGAAFVPLLATPFAGSAATPLHPLAPACVGLSSFVYGRRTGSRAAALATQFWYAQAGRPSGDKRHAPPRAWRFGSAPIAYFMNAHIVAALAALAYNARSLDSTLADLLAQRKELLDFGGQLVGELEAADELVRRVLADASNENVRKDALCAIGRLHEAHAALAVTADLRQTPRPWWERVSDGVKRLFATGTLTVHTRTHWSVLELSQRSVAYLEPAMPEDVSVTVDVDPGVAVRGVAGAVVVGAGVVAGIVNALRHGRGVTSITVTAESDGDQLMLEIADDGAPPDKPEAIDPGQGMKTLGKQTNRLGGKLTAQRTATGFSLRITLPDQVEEEDDQLLAWSGIEARIEAISREAIVTCAVMVWAGLLSAGGRSSSPSRWAASAAATAAVPALYLLDVLLGKDGEPPANWPLAISAIVTAASTDPHRGSLAGFTSAGLSRYARRHPPAPTLMLYALNVLAIRVAFRGGTQLLRRATRAMVVSVGPLATAGIAEPALGRLRTRERAVVTALSVVEKIDSIAVSFHGQHSALTPMRRLAQRESVTPLHRQQLEAAADRIDALTLPRSRAFQKMLGALVAEVTNVIGRRIWPGRVGVTVDLEGLDSSGPISNLHRMKLRRTALNVADLIAREATSHQRVSLDGSRPLGELSLHVSGVLETSTVTLTVSRVAHSDEDSDEALRQRIRQLGAGVGRWSDQGELTVALYPEE